MGGNRIMEPIKHAGVRRKGKSLRQLAEVTGRSTRWVSMYTSEPREDYLARAEERGRRVLELRAEGKTIRAIAEELDVSVGTVHRHIKAARK